MRIPRLPAAAALLVLLLAVAGVAAAAQEEAVAAGHVGPEESAAQARAKEEVAALAAELGQLRAKVSALEASIVAKTQELKSKDGGIETTTKVEQLGQVHGAWLPPWLATHAARLMELMSSLWNEHGKPAFNSLLQKASEKSMQAKEWAKPHMETAKAKWIPVIKENWAIAKTNTEPYKWIPVIKENWAIAKTNTEPYVRMVSAKSVEVYQASRDAISPHVLKAHEFADPYFQEAKKLSKPYIDQVAKASKPHVVKLKTTLKPYTEKAGHAYGNFLETATLYHQQAQATIMDYMHQHELLKQFATGELVWYLASACLLMPVYVLYILVTETFCTRKQKKKSPRSDKAHHGHRRHKRRHADK